MNHVQKRRVKNRAREAQELSLAFDPNIRLYTSDQVGYPISQLQAVLDRLFTEDKPLILFVHGRGNEPKKSLQGGSFIKSRAVHKLEGGYGANVLMFSWDSKKGSGLKDRSRPLSNMPAAADAFAQVLIGIKKYQQIHSNARPIALIAHSMGNIVVEATSRKLGGWIDNDNKSLFSNILLSASDADDINHTTWVEKISLSENVYITINADDKTLRRSYDNRPIGAAPLGLEPGNQLASHATYVDISQLGKKKGKKTKTHELFHKSSMHNQVNVCEFFKQALTGLPVVLNAQNSSQVGSTQRYKLLHKRDSASKCFT